MLQTISKFLIVALIQSVFFSSCVSTQKIRNLKNQTIINLRLEYDKTIPRIDGAIIPFGVSVVLEDQKRVTSKGFSNGTLRWNNFKITADGAKISNGKITIPYSKVPPQKITIKIIPKYQPDMVYEEVLTLNQLTDIKIQPYKITALAPGGTFKLSADAYFNNGIVKNYPLLNATTQKSLHLSYEVFSGRFNNGTVTIRENIDEIQDHSVYFYIWDNTNSIVQDSLQIMLNYIKDYNQHTWGSSGSSGYNGLSGSDGSSGSEGQNGNNGSNGNHGMDGENGRNADDIEIFADAYFDSILQTTLIYTEVKIIETGEFTKYLINPDGGNLYVTSSGGSGGDGGDGGKGGNGGNGGNGIEHVREWKDSTGVHKEIKIGRAGHGGNGGYGGDAGYGGHGGNGGNIILTYTKRTKPYLFIFKLNSTRGSGGRGGSGGYYGSGGQGGSGRPNGSNGENGRNGKNGYDGSNGYDGIVDYIEIPEKE